jgi:hypothetical protein
MHRMVSGPLVGRRGSLRVPPGFGLPDKTSVGAGYSTVAEDRGMTGLDHMAANQSGPGDVLRIVVPAGGMQDWKAWS